MSMLESLQILSRRPVVNLISSSNFDLSSAALAVREVPDSAVREEPVPEELVRDPLQRLVRDLVQDSGQVRTCGTMPGRR
eukprot:4989503-Pyramimonas_sp.AAC.1